MKLFYFSGVMQILNSWAIIRFAYQCLVKEKNKKEKKNYCYFQLEEKVWLEAWFKSKLPCH